MRKIGSHLRKIGNHFQVFVHVPRHLHKQVGKAALIRSLGVATMAEAERIKWPVIQEMRGQIAVAEARHKGRELGPVVKLANVVDYDGLLKAMAARRRALGLAQIQFDDIAGFQPGYTGKIECRAKRLTPETLDVMLVALRCRLALEGEPVGAVKALRR